MPEIVKYKKKLLAIIYDEKNYNKKKGVIFPSLGFLSLQIGFMTHMKNHLIKPHTHINHLRKISKTAEVLFVRDGILRVDFYSRGKKYLFSKILKKNNIIILLEDSHGFKVIKKCFIIEIKQGPYNSKLDKIRFKNIDENKIKIKK